MLPRHHWLRMVITLEDQDTFANSAIRILLMPFFLGIDGGGTKTRCVVGDEKSELGAGSSSSSKVQRVGEACARDALAGAVNEACVQAGISPRQIVRIARASQARRGLKSPM